MWEKKKKRWEQIDCKVENKKLPEVGTIVLLDLIQSFLLSLNFLSSSLVFKRSYLGGEMITTD